MTTEVADMVPNYKQSVNHLIQQQRHENRCVISEQQDMVSAGLWDYKIVNCTVKGLLLINFFFGTG